MVFLQIKITIIQNKKKNICTHCERNGRTIDGCYRKHEFNPIYKYHSRKNNVINNIDAINETSNDSTKQSAIETQDVQLSKQQYQVLMSLIQ